MIFNSLHFLYFFLVVFITHQICPQKFKWVILLLSSYFFYGYANFNYLPLLIIPTIIVYFFAIKIDYETDKK